MRFPELSYANAEDPPLKRGLIRMLERMSGRDYFAPLYDRWRRQSIEGDGRIIRPMLGMIGVDLEIVARQWPPALPKDRGLVLVANHPYGILDGIAALTLAEDLGRPFKVLINRELMKVPELAPFSLPIDFRETDWALATNLATRNAAIGSAARRHDHHCLPRRRRRDSTASLRPCSGAAVEALHRADGAGGACVGAARLFRGPMQPAVSPGV